MSSTRGLPQSVCPVWPLPLHCASTRRRRDYLARLLTGVSMSLLVHGFAMADSDIPDGQSNQRVAPGTKTNPALNLQLPNPMPALRNFDELTRFQVENARGRLFAIDPKSIRFVQHIVMMTVGVQGSGGATNTGYYAIDCRQRQYRLMGYPSAGTWKTSSAHIGWRNVMDLQKRPPQFLALFGAACELGGLPIQTTTELIKRLGELETDNQ